MLQKTNLSSADKFFSARYPAPPLLPCFWRHKYELHQTFNGKFCLSATNLSSADHFFSGGVLLPLYCPASGDTNMSFTGPSMENSICRLMSTDKVGATYVWSKRRSLKVAWNYKITGCTRTPGCTI
ncbi:unnamed protein product [Cuscuta epithymum]|uniref:Uncharacterized protein n=1 Tax=Cuscuta epithymum TaxID=186058 RepID=A0AAV0ED58_9ASTE|nr:unnamed protein product [Cuscuta epithymum]CAH9121214.1 unnamed protein product [Cuscuta epithymum]